MQGQQPPSPEEQLKMQQMLQSADDVACECGGLIFMQGVRVKKISALNPHNTTGQAQMANMPVMYCVNCNKEIDPFK
ncbi:hypothetical protein KAR91_74075 [Candidatus Pacearchaeota archaeon]|nr:hypothetical protein [Candidatus Pacearchaeota archaeon]